MMKKNRIGKKKAGDLLIYGDKANLAVFILKILEWCRHSWNQVRNYIIHLYKALSGTTYSWHHMQNSKLE